MRMIAFVAVVALSQFQLFAAQDSRPESRAESRPILEDWEADEKADNDAVAKPLADCEREIGRGDLDAAQTEFLKATAIRNRMPRYKAEGWNLWFDPVGTSETCLRLSLAFEERRDWKRASTIRSERQDIMGGCGNCMGGQQMDRTLQLARLRLLSGQVDEALMDIWCVVRPDEAKSHGRPGIFLAANYWETVEAYFLAALLADRAAEALEVLRKSADDADSRGLLAKLEALGNAYTKKNADAFLDAATNANLGKDVPGGWHGIARNALVRLSSHLLDRLGDPAKNALSKRLAKNDVQALTLAIWTHYFDLIPLVESFRATPNDPIPDDAHRFAIEVFRFRQRFAK